MNNKTPITVEEIDFAINRILSCQKKEKIINCFQSESDKPLRIKFVRKAFGCGEMTVPFPDSVYGIGIFSSGGFVIERKLKDEPLHASLRLTWTQVTNRIIRLIARGEFTEKESRP